MSMCGIITQSIMQHDSIGYSQQWPLAISKNVFDRNLLEKGGEVRTII